MSALGAKVELLYAPTGAAMAHKLLRSIFARVDDRVVFDKLVQVLRFGCSDEVIADVTCSATTIRGRRDE